MRIAPQPGGLNHLRCRTPHPDGFIDFEMRREDDVWKVSLKLPEGGPGVFEFGGKIISVRGAMEINVEM